MFRPGLSDRGRYYAVTFLNQIPMSNRPQVCVYPRVCCFICGAAFTRRVSVGMLAFSRTDFTKQGRELLLCTATCQYLIPSHFGCSQTGKAADAAAGCPGGKGCSTGATIGSCACYPGMPIVTGILCCHRRGQCAVSDACRLLPRTVQNCCYRAKVSTCDICSYLIVCHCCNCNCYSMCHRREVVRWLRNWSTSTSPFSSCC